MGKFIVKMSQIETTFVIVDAVDSEEAKMVAENYIASYEFDGYDDCENCFEVKLVNGSEDGYECYTSLNRDDNSELYEVE